VTRSGLRRQAALLRRSALRRRTPLRRDTPLLRGPSLTALRAQRAKVAGQGCIVCGATTRIDSAHLVARAWRA
jgi:hypothetical protein